MSSAAEFTHFQLIMDLNISNLMGPNACMHARQEAKTGRVAADAAEVKLYCQVPAITKIDSSLGALVNCMYVLTRLKNLIL